MTNDDPTRHFPTIWSLPHELELNMMYMTQILRHTIHGSERYIARSGILRCLKLGNRLTVGQHYQTGQDAIICCIALRCVGCWRLINNQSSADTKIGGATSALLICGRGPTCGVRGCSVTGFEECYSQKLAAVAHFEKPLHTLSYTELGINLEAIFPIAPGLSSKR